MDDRYPLVRIICRLLTEHSYDLDRPGLNRAAWDRLAAVALDQGVAPLLARRLDGRDVPSAVYDTLQREYYTAAAYNHLLYRELERILTDFDTPARSVRTVALKGIVLGTTLYPDPALRPLGDLDLLVRPEDWDTAVDRLQRLGYRERFPEPGAGVNAAATYHVHFRGGPERRVAVELHWNLVGSDSDWRTPDVDWFWERTEPWAPDTIDAEALQLEPTAHLLYLAAHLTLQHGGVQARLLWFYDLHLLLTAAGHRIDWDELVVRAEAFRWSAALHAALHQTHHLFDSPVPAGVLETLAARARDDATTARLLARKAAPIQTRTARSRTRLSTLTWPARLRLIAGLLLPRPKYVRWRYDPQPTWLWPLYYPYRWFDILRDVIATVATTNDER